MIRLAPECSGEGTARCQVAGLSALAGVGTGPCIIRSFLTMDASSLLLSLPDDLLFRIVDLCDPLDWVRLGATCKKTRQVTSKKKLWDRLVIVIPACDVAKALAIQTYSCVVANVRPKIEFIMYPSVRNRFALKGKRLFPTF